MHSKSDNIQIVINDRVDEIIEELFSITPLKGSDFIFYCVPLLYYKYYKRNS